MYIRQVMSLNNVMRLAYVVTQVGRGIMNNPRVPERNLLVEIALTDAGGGCTSQTKGAKRNRIDLLEYFMKYKIRKRSKVGFQLFHVVKNRNTTTMDCEGIIEFSHLRNTESTSRP
jgi:hypothetical protein